ncbi:MAG: carbohydrate ABC transporter permease [Defluviitaleaceae bacterium]|nr:carbohydrate ABC transporter permease [Defluviitaleaceae bacterium]
MNRRRRSKFAGTKINPTTFHRSQVKFYLILLPICVFMAVPIIFVIGQAFKSLGELFMFPPSIIPLRPTTINFRTLFLQSSIMAIPMWRFLINTLIVAVSVVALNMVVTVSGAYVLSKKKYRFTRVFFKMNQVALMFVATAVTIPRYLVVSNIGIMNTFFGHILPIMAIPVGLFLLKQFIDVLPDALFEAAKIDGANDFYIVKSIVIPLTKPALATMAILSFQMTWGNTETSNLFTTEEAMRTLAYFFNSLIAGAASVIGGAGIAAAAGLIMFVPNLIIFIFMQSKVMSTMTHSGIK